MGQFDRLPAVERDYWIAEWERQRMACPDHGGPLDECSDPDRKWYSYRRICYATMEREAAIAALKELRGENSNFHDGTFTDWVAKRSDEHPFPAGAGETIGIADTNIAPWDEFTTELDASPIRPPDELDPDLPDNP